jgi:hypothetical protein
LPIPKNQRSGFITRVNQKPQAKNVTAGLLRTQKRIHKKRFEFSSFEKALSPKNTVAKIVKKAGIRKNGLTSEKDVPDIPIK